MADDHGLGHGIWQRGGADVENLPDPFAATAPGGAAGPPVEPPKKPRRRWLRWGFNAFAALLLVTLLWLIVTAPLGRALEPLEDPAMLLLSEEGRPIARRGAVKDEPVDVTRLDPMTPAAFIAIEDRRFRSHWGIDPRAIGRAMVANVAGRRSPAGRIDADPAARQDQLPLLGPLAEAQGAGGDHRLLAGRLADQGRNPLALFVERLFRRRRLWPSRRVAALFRPGARAAEPGPVGDAGGHGAGAVAAGADAQPRAGAEAQPAGAPGDGRHRRHYAVARARDQIGAADRQFERRPDRHLFRRLGRAPGARRRSMPTMAR